MKVYMREYFLKNKEQKRAYDKRYYQKNQKKIKKREKKYSQRSEIKARKKEYNKEYNQRPEVKKRIKEFAIKNIDRNRKTKLKWIRNNPEKNRESKRKGEKIYAKKYPERINAGQIARRIPLGKKCQICGSTIKLERHHWRYDKPKLFATFCKECHMAQHRRKLL